MLFNSKTNVTQYKLGFCFQIGEETENDEVQAIKYRKVGADAENVDSIYICGFCWLYGWGVEKNFGFGVTLLQQMESPYSVVELELKNILRMGLLVRKSL